MIFEERLIAMISSDERQFLINQLAWIGISFGMNLPNTISYIISWYCRDLSTCLIAKKLAHRKSIPRWPIIEPSIGYWYDILAKGHGIRNGAEKDQ